MSAGRSRHVPLRRCAVCRSSLPQSQLIRFARGENGDWRIDRDRRAGGRGMWVCTEARCHERKALGRPFRAQAADVAEQLASLAPAKGKSAGGSARERADQEHADQEHVNQKASQDGGLDV